MAISEKELEEIKNDFDKTNKKICELYKKSGNEEILEMLYLGTHDPKSVAARSIAESFGLPLEVAEKTLERLNKTKVGKIEISDDGHSITFDTIENALDGVADAIQEDSEKICDAIDEAENIIGILDD